jgi:hypothetical protein
VITPGRTLPAQIGNVHGAIHGTWAGFASGGRGHVYNALDDLSAGAAMLKRLIEWDGSRAFCLERYGGSRSSLIWSCARPRLPGTLVHRGRVGDGHQRMRGL